jgi:hypothetical protein
MDKTAEPYEKIVMYGVYNQNQLADAKKWVLEGLIYFPNNV